MYNYVFDAEKCWYRNVCSKYNTKDCNPSCIRFMEMDFLMNNSGIPKNRQLPKPLKASKEDLETFKELDLIREDIVQFVKNGENLYIYSSNCGNGKTSWAIKLMAKYFDKVWAGNGFRVRALFIHVPTFLTRIKDVISKPDSDFNRLKELLMEVDLVVWDDIAATKLGDFDHSTLLTYIDQRVLSGLANIYTGNLSSPNIEKALGVRLSSRVWNNSYRLEIIGEDRRSWNG